MEISGDISQPDLAQSDLVQSDSRHWTSRARCCSCAPTRAPARSKRRSKLEEAGSAPELESGSSSSCRSKAWFRRRIGSGGPSFATPCCL